MGGGLMQLVAYGAQDIYLTGNPQITFFKVVYRRHTNFACEAIEQTFTGSVDFGRKISATIERNGDLVGKMYLEVNVDVGQDAQNNPKVQAGPTDIGGALLGLPFAFYRVGFINGCFCLLLMALLSYWSSMMMAHLIII